MTTAITNLFSGTVSKTSTGEDEFLIRVDGNGPASLEKFRLILSRDGIRAAARSVLFRHMEEGRIVVYLNKQVAFAGHVSFCEPVGESPLGPIRLEIESEDPTGVIDWLTGGMPERRDR